MKFTNHEWLRAGKWMKVLSIVVCLMGMGLESVTHAQAVSTTTVQGTVYLANGQPGTGTLVVSWPSFTTASGQLVTADSTTVTIAPGGFVSVNLAPNLSATPAGEYYTAVYYLSDGTTTTQYWVIPVATEATLAQVQAQVMPSTQAVQTASKAYVDQEVAALSTSQLSPSGGTLTGPLYLSGDPTQALQAADKHYVDQSFSSAVPLAGGTMTGELNGPYITATQLGGTYQVDQFLGADFGAKLQACLGALSTTYGGTCDARSFTGTLSMGSNLTISTANATVQLPCATISTANQIIATAGTRNVSLHGCALRGASTASGSQGGTVFLYSGTKAMVQVGDPTYAVDTMGFHLDNVVINTTASSSSAAQGMAAYRTQELYLESLYFLGNSNQTGMTLDGTGNYTGGTFLDDGISGFQTAVNAIGHQTANSTTTDWMNASTFVRLHIDCPTSDGSPISGSYGINLQQGDGNTFTGGDVEGCSTALHLGANAQNNMILGLRNENSTNQVVADAGSSYNSWITGGTMFSGQLIDNGTRNSFLDTFHRSFNGLNGDWYGSQADATVTNHYRLGIGAGNERGLLNRYQTDYGYRWTMGLSDATAGEQFYQILDELNNVYRFSVGQYNHGQSSTNNQTVINAAGTGAVVLNGSNNAGTGGVIFGSGGTNESTVATIGGTGNAQFNGSLQVGGATTLEGSATVKNQVDAEIDYILQAGGTTSQKESLIYNDWNGNSQWYMVKNATNDWALNSATGGLDSFKAYQSTNSGDTYVNASNSSGVVRINYESGAGTGFKVYGGSSSTLYAAFTGTTAIQFPGLAASSGHNCLQVDNSGYISNTGAACGTGSGSGTVNTGTSGQIAYYNGNGTVLSGTSTVSVTAGGTGASTASGALANLGGAALAGAAFTGPVSTSSTLAAKNISSIGPRYDVTQFGAVGNGATDDTAAIQAAFNACYNGGVAPYGGVVEFPGDHNYIVSSTINAYDTCQIEGVIGSSNGEDGPPRIAWNATAAGTVYNISGFTGAANTAPVYAPSSPVPYPQPYIVTFTAANSLAAGQWVEVAGLSTSAGLGVNRMVAQVASATSTTFTVVIPFAPTIGTFTDSGTATTVNVVFAFDANARYQQSISNVDVESNTLADTFNVGFYFGSRVDTGTHVINAQVAGSSEYGYYFPDGGINVDFDKGWRADGAGVAGIYWKVMGADSLGIANGTVDNDRSSYGTTSSGAAIVLDNAACVNNSGIHFTSRNMKIEINTSLASGLGAFTMYDCPSNSSMEAFWMDLENTWVAPASTNSAGFNFPSFVVSPANDAAVSLNILNGDFPSGISPNTTSRWVGIPELLRSDTYGATGWIPLLSYAPSNNSDGAYTNFRSPISLVGDVNISQLWQDGISASDFLYSDTAFAALPNATTLFAGQILAPPSYWSGVNSKRYALDVVYQTGTTGTPNGGATTCTGTSGAAVLTCSSATDLSAGQRITVGTDTNKTIYWIDATNPSAVLVHLTSGLASTYATATALSFSAPLLGPEMQMPTKSAAAPTTQTWSQGDMEKNSGAAVNGIAAWVNVGSGTPGTWAAVPLGNSSGVLAPAQIGTGTPATGQYVDGGTGAWTPLPSAGVQTSTPLWLTYLGTGANGSNTSAGGNMAGEYDYVNFTVPYGNTVTINNLSGMTIRATGTCTIAGTITSSNAAVSTYGYGGGTGGGGGGGTAAGTAGTNIYLLPQSGLTVASGGSAGAASGGAGGAGNTPSTSVQQMVLNAGMTDGQYLNGSGGGAGGSSGGAGGNPGQGLTLICGTITGTDGTHTGSISMTGANGTAAAANNTGGGGGGGGGVVILSSQSAVGTWPTINVNGGAGGSCGSYSGCGQAGTGGTGWSAKFQGW